MSIGAVRRTDAAGVVTPTQHVRPTASTVLPGRPRWQRCYSAAAVVTDLAALVLAAGLYGVVGNATGNWVLTGSVVVVGVTVVTLACARAWHGSIVGQGSQEFARLLRGFIG